jgi:4-nitrophenyl phosphatase
MDGVLWRGDAPLPGLNELFATLDALTLPFVLATNNATKIAADYVAKLEGFGVSVQAARILTSAEATASYLRHAYPAAREVYMVGESGLRRAVEARGFRVVPPEAVRAGARPLLVALGLARASLSYELLAMAALALNAGAAFVATNADRTLPSEVGELPGAGAILALLTTATGKKPIVVGKPQRPIFEEALRRLGRGAEDTWMVGDRLETDIVGAHAVGMKTALVLSGVSSRDDLKTSPVQPDLILDDIRAVTAWLRQAAKRDAGLH